MKSRYYRFDQGELDAARACRGGRDFIHGLLPLVMSSDPEENLGLAEMVMDRAVDDGLDPHCVGGYMGWLLYKLGPVGCAPNGWPVYEDCATVNDGAVDHWSDVWVVAQEMAWLADYRGK